MTLTTIRLSDTEVQVERTVYTFGQKNDADAFQRCLVDTSIDSCYRTYSPLAVHPTMPGEHPDDPGRSSTIAPSPGGMP